MLVENFKIWFNKDKDSSSILEYFIPTIVHKDDKNFLVLEVPLQDNNIDINIYNDKSELIYCDKLINFEYCNNIIQLNGVYLESNRLYCNWELVQIKVD